MTGAREITVALVASIAMACGSDNPQLTIVVDLPPDSSPAYPFAPDLINSMRLGIASAGDPTDLSSTSEELGESLALTDVAFGRDLVLHLYGELDNAEVAYGRSCAFDFESEDPPPTLHIYFSRLVRWGTGPTPTLANRLGGHALEREGGSIIIAGGTTVAPIEVFNPHSGELSIVTEAPDTTARTGGVLARIGTDKAVIVGGTAQNMPVRSIEVLPDLRDSLSSGLELREHAAVSLVGERALVAGGQEWDGAQFVTTRAAYELRLGDGDALESPRAVGELATARRRHSMTRLSDEVGAAVLVAGGLDDAGLPVAAAEVYRPLGGVFEAVPGTLVRWGHRAIRVPGGSVLIIGGFEPDIFDGSETAALTLALFDPIQGTFAPAGDLPGGAAIVGFTATELPDGRILIVGGRSATGDIVATAYIARFDPINGQVDISETDSLSAPRAGHTATLACDGTVIVVGGESPSGSLPIERYNPPPEARR